ncbi:MAG: hypothetical protein U0746_11840 [Gemmataceae bacterium]
MSEPNRHEPPTAGGGDIVHSGIRAVISAIPYVGSPALEFFNFMLAPPVERRRQEWMEGVGEALRDLESRGAVTADDLQRNEAFVSTALQAAQVAVRTHQREKLDALRNAVTNAALPGAPDDSLQLMFVGMVDRFTEWHLRVLKFLADPPQWFASRDRQFPVFMTSSLSHILTEAYPELKDRRDFYDQVAKELLDCGLLNTDGLHAMMSANGAAVSRTTDLGNRFLKFVAGRPAV